MKNFNGQQYKTISIIGSFRKQMEDIQRAKEIFLNKGFKVLVPKSTIISGSKDVSFVLLDADKSQSPRELEKDYLKALLTSDVVYCCNSNGYIGGTAMFELGYLIAKGQEVYFQEQPQEELISSLITEKLNICSQKDCAKSFQLKMNFGIVVNGLIRTINMNQIFLLKNNKMT